MAPVIRSVVARGPHRAVGCFDRAASRLLAPIVDYFDLQVDIDFGS